MKKITSLAAACLLSFAAAHSQQQATITIDAGQLGARVEPSLHGIFFEEISHGGEGGLYAELIQNRGFEESRLPLAVAHQDGFIVPHRTPHFSLPGGKATDWKMEWDQKSPWPAWSLQTGGSADIHLALTQERPLHQATPNSLKITLNRLDANGKNNLVNEGFWGINTVKGETYNLAFYARTAGYKGPLTASLQSADGTVLATYRFPSVAGAGWKKFSCALTAAQSDPKAKFVLNFGSTGTVWLDHVSLFPAKTFKNRPNGLRADLAQYLADLKPAFVRWPGGCFVEGINIENAPNWKRSLGPVEQRPGTYSPWGYWSSDGFGYHEFLQFCEDIQADALYVFNAGVSCDFRSGTFIPDEGVDSIIRDVLDGLEYALGPVSSKWGKLRAANGHPKPFPLKYVEVGNEQVGPRYARRYNWFYDAIKKKYPQVKIIASMGIADVNRHTLDSMKAVEIADEHAYKAAWWSMRNDDHFDKYQRGNWEMYVGEYATNAGVGRGNMLAALSDAVYIMAMERNGDLVKMSSYAPLLVNVNDVDWPVNLINFDASRSFGRISYYTIQLFNRHRADRNLSTSIQFAPVTRQAPLYAGGIGLATWDTDAEFKDVQVLENGNEVYRSDFAQRPEEWKGVRGHWKATDSSFAQAGPGAQRFARLQGKSFGAYTLKLKARKTSDATNAFIIPFAVKDDGTMMRAHIGSYVNSHCVFESVTRGMEVADLVSQKRLPAPIVKGRWYDITLEVGYDKVDCYLDGQLLMSYSEPPKFFSLAGRDEKTGDIILKMVNAAAEPFTADLQFEGVQPAASAVLSTLSAESPEAENSMAEPLKYVPRQETISGITRSGAQVELKPYSISVLRLKDPSWKGVAKAIAK
ncbi:alpha-L-arabinofuranosidase C-terminal domain-containing protein [Paraflavisolibacter sp. H34]|uniref:alpha-L-arabinofuranosidase C-terminal domain-containing protein n=1 Tax=Huijunlia imazamoxiresistens TaxID=3127457 RepID=UPI00301715BC